MATGLLTRTAPTTLDDLDGYVSPLTLFMFSPKDAKEKELTHLYRHPVGTLPMAEQRFAWWISATVAH